MCPVWTCSYLGRERQWRTCQSWFSLMNDIWAAQCWPESTGPHRGRWALMPPTWILFLMVVRYMHSSSLLGAIFTKSVIQVLQKNLIGRNTRNKVTGWHDELTKKIGKHRDLNTQGRNGWFSSGETHAGAANHRKQDKDRKLSQRHTRSKMSKYSLSTLWAQSSESGIFSRQEFVPDRIQVQCEMAGWCRLCWIPYGSGVKLNHSEGQN